MDDLRRLYVLRHAKSSWEDAGQSDHERPLAPRGQRAVRHLAEYLELSAIRPELVLCSNSRRTLETLEGVRPGGETLIEPALYTASVGELVERLRQVPAGTGSVMVIGHNPAAQMLVLRLARSDRGDEEGLAAVRRKFPTGGLATLELPVPWAALVPGCAELTEFVRPKALPIQSR